MLPFCDHVPFPPTLGNGDVQLALSSFSLAAKILNCLSYVLSLQLEIGCTDRFILNMESVCGLKLLTETQPEGFKDCFLESEIVMCIYLCFFFFSMIEKLFFVFLLLTFLFFMHNT